MSPNAESQALLDARRAANIPPVWKQTLAEVRGSRKEWQVARPVPKVEVGTISERTVPVKAGEIKVRLYRDSKQAPCPAILYFHGGGWVLGDLDHSDALCRRLAVETGYLVLNVDYRLAPEHRYPTAAEDCFAAFKWAVEAAGQLGLDPARIAVAGASAGGNLAAAISLMARDRGGVQPAAQLLAYPVLDDACDSPSYRQFGEGFIVATSDMRWYWRQYLSRAEDAAESYACPLKEQDLSGLPPALIITAECDPIRDDGERFAQRLNEAGVPATLSRYQGSLHGFFAMPGSLANGTAAVEEASAFLKQRLGS